jgi:prevent-host-death family protein
MPKAKEINIHNAKTHFSELLRQVAKGKEIVIANRGVPVARLVPIPAQLNRRELGKYEGQVVISDDFDAPLPEEILKAFEGDGSGPEEN